MISNTPFGNQQPTANKFYAAILLWWLGNPLELRHTIVLVLTKLHIKKIGSISTWWWIMCVH